MIDIDALKLAIEKGDYKISFEEPNNIEICSKYDGTKFYVLKGDGCCCGVSGGYCYVDIDEYRFSCDLQYGKWDLDDYNEEDKDEIIEILEDIPGVICCEMMEPDDQMKVYFKANPNAEKGDFYWYDDDERPKDVDYLDDYDTDIVVRFTTSYSEDWSEETFNINCGDLYELYKTLGIKGEFPNDIELQITDDTIKSINEELYYEILDVITYEDDTIITKFVIPINADLIEEYLG